MKLAPVKTEYNRYLVLSNSIDINLKHRSNAEMDIIEQMALNSQVDIELLHKLANEMIEVYPRLWDCPKDIKAKKHWYFLTSTILCKSVHRKNPFFPRKVAKAFAAHESKQDYTFNEVLDNQMTIDDLIK